MPIGDLLGAVLVDGVVVARAQRLVVTEGDLLLAEVALPLDALAVHAGAVHPEPDLAQQRLQPRRGVDGVVDVVVTRRCQPSVSGRPGLPVALLEHHELQLGADEGRQAPGGEPVGLGAQDGAGGGGHWCAGLPVQIRHHQRGAGQPRDQPQGAHVRPHHHVAVAGAPARHRVPVDGVHIDVYGQQVVAALGAVGGDLFDEQPGRHPLAGQPALHVGEGDDHRVDLPGGHQVLQLRPRQRSAPRIHAHCELSLHRQRQRPRPAPTPKAGHRTCDILFFDQCRRGRSAGGTFPEERRHGQREDDDRRRHLHPGR